MKHNVLVFPAGEINSIELHDSLSNNVNIEVYGASSVNRHGPYVFKYYNGNLPNINEYNFIDEFNKLIDEWKIDLIFPTHDSVVLFLTEHRKEINAKIIASSLKTAQICRDKRKTYDLFIDKPFCPKIFNKITFPCFIKPICGQGSKGAHLIETPEDVPNNIILNDYVICEYLPGEEFTVDCFTDIKGDLKAVLPRKRTRTLAGVSVSSESLIADEKIKYVANEINNKLEFLGLWFFQIKKDRTGEYKLLEISSRCAGSMCLSRARGVNLPLLSVYAALGYDINVFENNYDVIMDRTLISRYKIDYDYNVVYIDYDDTIIVNDSVCLSAIRFIYQCKNKGIKIVLVSRHDSDHDDLLEENLKKHFIDINIFDEINKLSFDDDKTSFINPEHSIFIDNAYAERKNVHDKFGIPVFDVEGIEILLDWRK